MVHSAYQRLSNYRTLFAFTFKPLTNEAKNTTELPFFRADNRLSDSELRKLLTEFNK
jgi:hypothetical protein